MTYSRVAPIDPTLIPTASCAVASFRACGGHLTTFSAFGEDPLDGHDELMRRREEAFFVKFPSFDPIFHAVANGDGSLFKEAILLFVSITSRLAAQ